MLRSFGFRLSRMDGIKNGQNRGTAKAERLGDNVYIRLINGVKDDVKMVGVTEEEASDGEMWRQMISCGSPLRGAAKKKREEEVRILGLLCMKTFQHENI